MALFSFLEKRNNAGTTLAADVVAGDLTVTVAAAGALPLVIPFLLTVYRTLPTDGTMEIMRVTNIAGNVLTVTRAQEGTAAVAHLAADVAWNYQTVGAIEELQDAINTVAADYVRRDGTFDLIGDWTIATKNVTLTAGRLTAAELVGTKAAFGAGGIISAATIVDIAETITGTEYPTRIEALSNVLTVSPSGALTDDIYAGGNWSRCEWASDEDGAGANKAYMRGGQYKAVTKDGTVSGDLHSALGFRGGVVHYGTGTIIEAIGVLGAVANNADDSELGDITTVYSIRADCSTGKSTGTIATRHGFYVTDTSGSGKLTNQYGLFVEDLAAGTNNCAIWLAGSGIDNGLHMGGDVEFYRSGANEATLPDDFQIGGEVNIGDTADKLRLRDSGATAIMDSEVNDLILRTSAAEPIILQTDGGNTRLTVTAAGNVEVANDLRVDGVVTLPYLAGAPAGLANGMVWMETDGLHLYYNGAEKVVAGA